MSNWPVYLNFTQRGEALKDFIDECTTEQIFEALVERLTQLEFNVLLNMMKSDVESV